MRLWAPTAKSVKLHLFDTATSDPASQVVDMVAGESGTWSAAGDAGWSGKYYLYEVEAMCRARARSRTTWLPIPMRSVSP